MGGNRLDDLVAENARLREQLQRHQTIGTIRGEVLVGEIVDALVAIGAAAEHGNQHAKAILNELHGALERTRGQAHGLTVVDSKGGG